MFTYIHSVVHSCHVNKGSQAVGSTAHLQECASGRHVGCNSHFDKQLHYLEQFSTGCCQALWLSPDQGKAPVKPLLSPTLCFHHWLCSSSQVRQESLLTGRREESQALLTTTLSHGLQGEQGESWLVLASWGKKLELACTMHIHTQW